MGSESLRGKRVAITGAGRGIGLATAKELHRRGASVTIGDIDIDVAKEAAASLGDDVAALPLNVTDTESFETFLRDSRATLDGLDVLINNAGVMPIGHFLDLEEAVVRRSMQINLLGPILGMRVALPDMIAQGHGHIINVASSAGRTAVPGGLNYCAHKAGLVHLTEGARLEFGSRGIDFTCVMPAFTNTDLISGTKGTRFIKNVEPEDVAKAIAKAVERKSKDVYVPGSLRAIYAVQPLMGRRLRDAMYNALNAYDTFLDIDPQGRADYNQRIRES